MNRHPGFIDLLNEAAFAGTLIGYLATVLFVPTFKHFHVVLRQESFSNLYFLNLGSNGSALRN